ncbi:saccharopine dehydrogenase [Actinoplanes sp. NPDC051861]|uniref:saccharopine dehydrogenase n=1 Tax=Actinoplanes sp. NPDC051861 TaxID=3155170 RepID=UPI003431A558
MNKRVAVLGASGHTGTFVVAELRRRGFTPIPCGRGTDLDAAFQDADAVINCAGPFASTAAPAITAAIRAGIPYLDVTAELEVVRDTFAGFADAPIPIVPAAAFYGGLGDLLATAAASSWPSLDQIFIAYGLSSWHPTSGTRKTGQVSAQRRDGRRVMHTGGTLRFRDGDAPRGSWTFPASFGTHDVIGEFTMADSVTIPTHLDVPEIDSCMTANAVADLHGSSITPSPGLSSQRFVVEVVARSGTSERRAWAGGQDIYAITAPLVVEATHRLLSGEGDKTGVATLGARFHPADFLDALSPTHLTGSW